LLASTASSPEAQRLFLDMVVQWRELAAQVRSLKADAEQIKGFYRKPPKDWLK
jgi:hypothetical protein